MNLAQLKSRKLVQWVLAYAAGAWATLQVVDLLTDRFGWSGFVIRALTVFLAVGVVAVIVIAWFHGEKGRQRIPPLEAVILVALLLFGTVGAFTVGKVPERTAANATGTTELAPAPQASIAVLPFRNLTANAEDAYLADGITEQLRAALGKVEGLRVKSSTMLFADAHKEVKLIAQTLGVRDVLQATVQKSGNRVRVNAALVDADGFDVWSETYDRDLADALSVQEDIARAIAKALAIKLLPSHDLRNIGMSSNQANDLYWRGTRELITVLPEPYRRAANYFREAIKLDPRFARAYAGLALALRWTNQHDAVAAAHRALQLDSTLADAHYAIGSAHSNDDEALYRKEIDAALRLDPSHRWARYGSGMSYLVTGTRRQATMEADRLLVADPLSPQAHYMAATIYNHAGYFERADSLGARGAKLDSLGWELSPKWPPYWNRGFAHLMLGHFDLATEYWQQSYAIADEPFAGVPEVIRAIKAVKTRSPGWEAEQQRGLQMAARFEHAAPHSPDNSRGWVSLFYLLLDDRESMYRVLEKRRPGGVLPCSAAYDAVRKEPRFQKLLVSIGQTCAT